MQPDRHARDAGLAGVAHAVVVGVAVDEATDRRRLREALLAKGVVDVVVAGI